MAKTSVTICSVFFKDLMARRDYMPVDRSKGYTNTEFRIPACVRGEHRTLKVIDHAQLTYVGNGQSTPIPVYAETINGAVGLAEDLVSEWAKNVLGGESGGGPGVIMCEGDEPTKEEIDRAVAMQTAWANHICTLAEIDWINGKKLSINSTQREAAVWLGKEADYEWMSDRAGGSRNQVCPMCARAIPAQCVVCPECRNVVDFGKYQGHLEKMEKLQAQVKTANAPAPLPPPIKAPTQQVRA